MKAIVQRLLLTLLATTVCLVSSIASAQSLARHTMTTWWPSVVPPGGLHSLEAAMRLNSVPDVFYQGVSYIQRFRLQQGTWGSIGLRKNTAGVAIWFAMDGALQVDALGGSCDVNPAPCTNRAPIGGTLGAMVPYVWEQNGAYRVRVWASSWDASGTWWSASVIDDARRREVVIGRIRVPNNFGLLDGVTSSAIETYANAGSHCGQLGYTSVLIAPPTYNNGALFADRHQNNIAPGLCDSAISVLNNAIRQEVGVR